MSSIDRTAEFFALCQSLPSNHNTFHADRTISTGRYAHENTKPAENSNPVGSHADLRSFHKSASHISQQINATATLLSELASLIQNSSRSLFESEESDQIINNLVLRIKNNIESLHGQLDEAARTIAQNKRKLGTKTSQANTEASNLVGQLQEEIVVTTKGFKEILQVRSDRIQERNKKKQNLFGDSKSNNIDAVGSGCNHDSSVLLGNRPRVYDDAEGNRAIANTTDPNRMKSGGAIGGDGKLNIGPMLDLTSPLLVTSSGGWDHKVMSSGENSTQLPRPRGIIGNGGGSAIYSKYSEVSNSFGYSSPPSHASILPVLSPLQIQQMEQQSGQSQLMQLIPDQNYLQQRADAMSQVEENIVQLGTIFNKLAVMVSEHQDLVQRVEDNVEEANENINLSLATLTDTLTSLRTNRGLFFKVMAILIVFIIFFITFFA